MKFEEFEKIIKKDFPELTGTQLEQFQKMEALYKEWNAKINVISRKDIDGLYLHHVLHSLGIAAYLKYQKPEIYNRMRAEGNGMKILDLGTGGGFPGIPLAIFFPEVHFTLCDSIGKKITVATEVASSLRLENVTTVNARAESLTEQYDFIVSRAVTALDNFMPWVKGRYSQGILYLKGGDISEEIARTMGKFSLPKGSVHTWPISSWVNEEFFETKLVIYLEKFCN